MADKQKANKPTRLTKPSTAAEALKLAFGAGKPSKAERVRETLGTYIFLYYRYLDHFKSIPSSLDDMIDGLIYIHLINYRES